jgi:hypothetical protein
VSAIIDPTKSGEADPTILGGAVEEFDRQKIECGKKATEMTWVIDDPFQSGRRL